MSRPTLAQQLKQLESEDTAPTVDIESAYSNLDGLVIPERKGNEGREHYLDVGPSRLRGQFGDMGDKYGGEVRGRQKIFDDDEDEEEDEEEEGEGGSEEDGDEDDEEEDDEEEEEGEGDEDEEEEVDEEEEEDDDLPPPPPKATSSSRLDPVAALRDSRMKDIEKGQAIKRQKVSLPRIIILQADSQAIFDAIVTLRITFQKALTASTSLPTNLPTDAAGEVSSAKEAALQSLGDLNERLFALREGIRLPGTEQTGSKRKREDQNALNEEYWLQSARDSFALTDA
jgi:protein AATF/BFR2